MKYSTILFDVDGTLIDFKKAERFSFYYTLKSKGISVDQTLFSRYHQLNEQLWSALERREIAKDELVIKRFRDLFQEFRLELDPVEINRLFLENLALEVVPMDGALPILQKLSKQYDLSVITNAVSSAQHRRLEAAGLKRFFSEIIVSEEAKASKPESAFFDYAFKQLGNPPKESVLVIGDSLTADIQGALNYGLDCCYYNPNEENIPEDLNPTYTISHLWELEKLLLPEKAETYSNVRDCYLDNGYNCAETMLLTLAKENGLTLSGEAMRAIGSFGGGMASGETCGALAGLMAYIGLTTIDTKAHQSSQLKERCQCAVGLWKETFGTLQCSEIKGKYIQKGQRCVATCELCLDLAHQLKELEQETAEA